MTAPSPFEPAEVSALVAEAERQWAEDGIVDLVTLAALDAAGVEVDGITDQFTT